MKRPNLNRYGDWALITGASMGLGKAFAQRIAAQGLNCVLVALEQDLLDELAEELSESYSIECRPIGKDLTDDDFLDVVDRATADIEIAILVNNAGVCFGREFWTREPGQLAKVVKLNCLVPTVLTRHFLPGMLSRDRGAIVMVSSLMGLISASYVAVYSASKAFDLHFGESLWGELRKTGVDCITLCPAGMRTNFYATEGFRPDEIKRLNRLSDPPERMADLALNKLGKRCTVGPLFSSAVSAALRPLPRNLALRITAPILNFFNRPL